MTILFNSDLSCRDFASHLLYVPDLLEWVKAKRLHLRTTPAIESYEFVQVENLLCAIERKAGDLTIEQAHEIVANDPALKNERAAHDPTSARWLLGAEAHRKWRELLSGAIAAHELALLDFGSKLPIQTAPATDAATPAPVVQATETKEQRQDRRLKACIDAGLPMNDKRTLSRLPDGVGDVADRESVTRQAFSTDVKAALKRRESAKREGVSVHHA